MTTYELATKLKGYGFPYPWTITWIAMKGHPNLSELIEACEGRMWSLQYYKSQEIWCCNEQYEANTPEEAVANLWIALKTPLDAQN